MARNKLIDPAIVKPKIFTSADEISQAIVKLRARIHQVEELKKDGLPYRDALRVTAEYQVRDTIRDVYGERSPEYVEHQHLKIKINSKHAITETVALLQHLVVTLEEQRLEMLGLRSKPVERKPTSVAESQPAPPESQKPEPGDGLAASHQVPPDPPRGTEPPPSPQPAPACEASPSRMAPFAAKKLKLSAEAPLLVQDNEAPPAPDAPSGSPTAMPGQTAPHTDSQEKKMAPQLNVPGQPAAMRPSASGVVPASTGIERRSMPPSPAVAEPPTGNGLAVLRQICGKFHRVARQLRQRPDDRPTLEVEDERDMTDLLHALLSIEFDEIMLEEWAPPYAEGVTRADLCLKDEGIVVVAKKTRPGLGAKALTQQVSADFERYAHDPDCKILFCFIYDPEGRIGNPKGLEGDLTLDYEGRRVEVLISPK